MNSQGRAPGPSAPVQAAGWSSRRDLNVLSAAIVLVLALLFGLATPVLPPVLLFAAPLGVLLLYAGARWPLLGAFFTLALAFEVIPSQLVPSAGSFKAHELLMMYLLGAVVLRAWLEGTPLLAPLRPYLLPLLYLVACIAASSVYVRFFAPNPFLLASYRVFVPLFVLPVILISSQGRDCTATLVRGMLVIALAMACIAMLQSMLDIRIMGGARMDSPEGDSGVARSFTGGATYVIGFGIYYMVNGLVRPFNGARAWYPLGLLILAGGLAMTFGRGVWVATGLGLLASATLYRGWRAGLLAGLLGSLLLALLLTALWVVRPSTAEAVVDRALSTASELESGGSFGWRQAENSYALKAIAARPWTGVGLGGEYKQTTASRGHFLNETYYIHNAYLAYPLRMGLHAAAVPFLFMLAFALMSYRSLRLAQGRLRAVSAALAGAFLVPCITSYTQPEWMGQGLGAFGLFMGAQYAVWQAALRERSA